MWKRQRRPRSRDLDGAAHRAPAAIHILRSRSGIDALDEQLTGTTRLVAERGVDADGDAYVLLGDERILAYVDQLDVAPAEIGRRTP